VQHLVRAEAGNRADGLRLQLAELAVDEQRVADQQQRAQKFSTIAL
jgi:hypothetical protein